MERRLATKEKAMKRCCCFLDTGGYVVGHRINAANTEVAGRGNVAGTLREVECNTVEPRYIKLGCNKLFSGVKLLRESSVEIWAVTQMLGIYDMYINFQYYQSGCKSWLF